MENTFASNDTACGARSQHVNQTTAGKNHTSIRSILKGQSLLEPETRMLVKMSTRKLLSNTSKIIGIKRTLPNKKTQLNVSAP